MQTFLKRPRDVVPQAQQLAIRALGTKYGHTVSRGRITYQNLEHYLDRIREELQAIGERPFFRAADFRAVALEKISSEAWNQAQERIYVDLRALYAALSDGTAEDASRGQVTRERFIQIRAQILQVVNNLLVYQFLKNEPEYQDAKFVNFHLVKNESQTGIQARVDPRVRLLELAPRGRAIQSKARFASRSTQVSFEHMGGGRPSGLAKEFGPEKMLDSREDSFWAQMIMADGPIFQTYYPSGDAGLGSRHDSSGALAHVYLNFDHVRLSNNLQILPFGEFPIRIVDIAYKESEGQTDWVKLPGFEVEDPTLDWVEVNFPPTVITALRITLEQVNYRSNLYHLPESMVKNAVLWQNIGVVRQDQVLHELDLTQEQKDAIEIDPQVVAELEAIEQFREILGQEPLQKGREAQYEVASNTYKAALNALTQIRPMLADDLLTKVKGEGAQRGVNTISVRTYEYVYGIREVQLAHITYQPIGTYETPKYRSKATLLEATMTTEERHFDFNDGNGDFRKTSTEWAVEIGRDRRYPIVPRNWAINDQLIVPDEYLYVDRVTRQAVTRFPLADLAVTLRENGEKVPLADFTITPYVPVSVIRPWSPMGSAIMPSFGIPGDPAITTGNRGLLTVSDARFDPNAIYTLRYVAAEGSDRLEFDERLDSVDLDEPEVFEKTSRDNSIVLRTFPYVDYNIVNSDDWVKQDDNQIWTFVPGLPNVQEGTVQVPAGSKIVTGTGTTWLTGIDNLKANCIRFEGETDVYPVYRVLSDTVLHLQIAHTDGITAGATYVAGERFESDSRLYGLQRNTYTPVQVFVNDVRAKNFTDYRSREHQAFIEVTGQSKRYEFIHSGNVIYFSRPINDARIEVYYSWLTEYIKIFGQLRCNIPANTVLTPQVNSLRLELKTSPL